MSNEYMKQSQLAIQVGGDHYKKYHPQPIELFAKLNWDYFRGSIADKVMRYQDKNGKEDLQKAAHLCLLAQELGVKGGCRSDDVEYVNFFCVHNRLSEEKTRIIKSVMYGDWMVCKEYISILIGSEYPEE